MKLPDNTPLTVSTIQIYYIFLCLVELSAICPTHLKMNHLCPCNLNDAVKSKPYVFCRSVKCYFIYWSKAH